MNLPEISKNVGRILKEFGAKELTTYPFLYGIYEQSEVVFDIGSGVIESNNLIETVINLSLTIGIACEKRTVDDSGEDSDTERDLESLISALIIKLNKTTLPGTKRFQFQRFTKLTPESGKWRAALVFNIPAYLTDLEENFNDGIGKIERIEFNY